MLRQHAVEARLDSAALRATLPVFAGLEAAARAEVEAQGIAPEAIECLRSLHLKYEGTDTTLDVAWQADTAALVADFEGRYRQQYGFLMPGRAQVIEAVAVEAWAAAK